MRLPLCLLAVAVLLLLVPTGASAQRVGVAVGIGDQRAAMFDDPNFQALGVRRARYFIRWNAIRTPGELRLADAYVAAARRAGVRVLMHISTDDLGRRTAKLPSVAAYRRNVGALVRRYRPRGVREWGTWNEANHDTQPTYKNPRRAAQFYIEMRRFCRGCTIVGLDVLDQKSRRNPSISYDNYIAAWFRAAGVAGRRLSVVGIHNYSEVNRRLTSRTRGIISAVRRFNRRAKFWYTETGGLAEFLEDFPCSERRQANRTGYMFDLARQFRRDVKRLYVYNYYGTDCQSRFDAGLVGADGQPRPAYRTFADRLKDFGR